MPVSAVKPRRPSGSQTDGPGVRSAGRRALPKPGTAEVAVTGKAATIGGLPVSVSVPTPDEEVLRKSGGRLPAAPSRVRVAVLDPTVATAAGVSGALLELSRSDGGSGQARARLRVDYSAFAEAFGANYGQRLRLFELPSCVLVAPEAAACQVRTDLGAVNRAGTLTADVTVGTGTFVALDATSTSDAGTFTATSLSPSYAWSAGGQGGEFGYTYPFEVPPAPGDLEPELALRYSSGTVDGQTLARNGQTSWVGEGWDLQVGYIERDYRPCSQDGGTTGDLCWFSPYNATMVFDGSSTELVRDNTSGVWKAADDDGLKVEKLNDTSLGNGDNDGEYWKVTTQDGTQYFFGRHKRYTGDAGTNSVLTVPVYGNNSGEPCFNASGFAASYCSQGYRWQLDYVVDPDGNSMSYFYTKWGSFYGRNNNNGVASYDMSAVLDHVDYGTRAGSEGTGSAPYTVSFGKTDRCTGACGGWADFPDTPTDLRCTSGSSCPSLTSPAFWSPWKLSTVTTKVWTGSAYRLVDKWDLTHTYPATGDNISPSGNDTSPNLWLQTLTHTGYAADGTTSLAEPTMTFGGTGMFNRVDWGNGIGVAPYTHYRLTSIVTGTGGQTVVTYSGAECVMTTKPQPHANPLRCFPQYFTPQQAAPGWGWFHKYVVTKVVDKDLTGGSPDEEASYTYSTEGSTDRSLWHHDYAETSQRQYRSWPIWRGYTTVTTTKGAVGGTQTVTKTLYHRGMDGDGMASTDNQSMVWGSRRAGITVPLGTPNAAAALAGQGGLCMETAGGGTTNGTNIQLGTCSGGTGQVWQVIVPQTDGRFSLQNPASGKCLDIDGAGTANTTNVQLWTCNALPQQMWQRQPDGSLRNPNSGRCMDAASWGTTAGTNIFIYDCDGHWKQVWQPQPNGSMMQPQPNRCIDVTGAGTADGTKIQSWTCNGLGQQVWRYEPGAAVGGALRNPLTNKCLDVFESGTANGTKVQLFTCNNTGAQRWEPQANGTLRNPQSGRCLDVPTPAVNGAQLRIWDCNTTLLQQWTHRVTDSEGLEGRAREEFTLDGGTVLGSSIHEYTVTPTGLRPTPVAGGQDIAARMVRETTTRERTWLAHNSSWRWTETQTSYDTYGLATDVKDVGDIAVAADDTCTHTDYARNTTTYLIDFPSAETVTDCTASPGPANTLSGSRTYYDGSTTLGAAPSRGLATRTSELASYTGSTANWVTTETATFDLHGRPLTESDALSRTTTTSYTPTSGGPVTAVVETNPAGHTNTSYLDVNGEPTSEVDENGKTTTYQYDPLGRLTKVWQPGRTTAQTPTVEYGYLLSGSTANWIQTKRLGPNDNQVSSFEIYDGQDRLRQIQATAPDGNRTILDVRYDTRGLTVKQSAFYNNASAPTGTLAAFADADVPAQRRYDYDTVGRPTQDALWSMNAQKWATTASYDGDRVNVDPPTGETAVTVIGDALGRTTALRQYLGGGPSGGYDQTSYGYDRLDRLTSVTDPVGNQWTYSYDRLDRLTSQTDPDTGTTTNTYDDADQLTTVTDAAGDVLHHTYDNLGRLTELRDTNATGALRASWLYDSVAKGELTATTRWVGTDAYVKTITGYTDLYQPTGLTTTIPATQGALAGTYTTTATYKPDGSMATIGHPAKGGLPAETVTYSYTNTGYLTSAAGTDTYLANALYNWQGALQQQTLGTGNNQVRLTTSTDDATGRLTKSEVHTENPASPETWIEKLTESYTYDSAGNLTSINETAAGATVSNQCFNHDYLRRMTEAWTTTAATCQTTPSQPAVGGPDPYWQSFTYDKTGNRLTDTRHTTSGDTTRTYTYPAAGSPQPHTLTGYTTSGSGPTAAYTYDPTGDLATRTITGQPNQTLTHDREGHLATLVNGANTHTYLYDADGNRLIATDPGTTTLYIDDTEYRLNQATNQVTATRYYLNAVRTTTDGLTWIATDHHGTGQLAINPTTLTTIRRRLTPFGETRGTPPTTWPDQKGFVGGTTDPTGYTHLGAREYDPTTGRFLSVDPITDHTDPQTLHGYSYANNNPASYTDADGRQWRPDCGGGGSSAAGGFAGGGGGGASAGGFRWFKIRMPRIGGGKRVKATIKPIARGKTPRYQGSRGLRNEINDEKRAARRKSSKTEGSTTRAPEPTRRGPRKTATGKRGGGRAKATPKSSKNGKRNSTPKRSGPKKSNGDTKGGEPKNGGSKKPRKGNGSSADRDTGQNRTEAETAPQEGYSRGETLKNSVPDGTEGMPADAASLFGNLSNASRVPPKTSTSQPTSGPSLGGTEEHDPWGTDAASTVITITVIVIRGVQRWRR